MYPAFLFCVPFCLSSLSAWWLADKAQNRDDDPLEFGWVLPQTFVEVSGDGSVTVMTNVIVMTVESG